MKRILQSIRRLHTELIKVWMPPFFAEDEELTRRARVLNAVILLVFVVLVIFAVASVTIFVERFFNLILFFIFGTIVLIAYGLMRLGKINLASQIIVYSLWVVVVINVFLSGGPRTVITSFILTITLIAGLLLGEKATVQIAILSALTTLAMVVWELTGHPLPSVYPLPQISGWVDLVVCLLVVTITINQSTHSYRQALSSAHQELVERKKVEQVLRENEQRYAGIAENIPGLTFQIRFYPGGKYNFTYANRRGLEMMGLPVDLVEKGWELSAGVYSEDRQAFVELLQETVRKRAVWRTEYRRRMPDGQLRWVLCAASPVVDGDTVLYNGVLLDIDEAKQAKAESERLNQALQKRVVERTHELTALSRVMTLSIQSSTPTQLAKNILDIVVESEKYSAGMIHLAPDDNSRMLLEASCGLPSACTLVYQTMPANDDHLCGKVAISGDRWVVSHLPATGTSVPAIFANAFESYGGMPIRIKGRLRGVLSVFSAPGQTIQTEFISFLATVADMLGEAIDNIHLRQQAEQAAMLEERQRLARDLHDSVSQTLFSASALAETLPLVWDQDPARGKSYMTSLLRLTRAALAEMRTLLVELRPQALLRTDLGDLVRQLSHGFAGHTQAEVVIEITGKGVLAADVQTVFFRVTQEALNNIAKHARANEVSINFQLEPAQARLSVADNGQGFDMTQNMAGFGIKIMQERAATVGARLELTSSPGRGTKVSLEWLASERTGAL